MKLEICDFSGVSEYNITYDTKLHQFSTMYDILSLSDIIEEITAHKVNTHTFFDVDNYNIAIKDYVKNGGLDNEP